jgi:hypothetical protein
MWILEYSLGSDIDIILTRTFETADDMMSFIADTPWLTVIKVH